MKRIFVIVSLNSRIILAIYKTRSTTNPIGYNIDA